MSRGKPMKLFDKMRQQKLLSTTLLLATLSIGIVMGTVVNTGVNAPRGQQIAPDATPLVIPHAQELGNEFTKLAKKLEPSVVNITADYTPKSEPQSQGQTRRRGRPQIVPPQDPADDNNNSDPSDLFRRFFGRGQDGAEEPQQPFKREQ